MKRTCILAILIAAIAASAFAQAGMGASNAAETDDATKSKILALEQVWYTAFETRDIKGLDSILDNGVLLVNDDGSVQTKGDFLAGMKYKFSQAAEPQVIPESLTVRVFGTTAIAIGVIKLKGIEHGKPYLRRERFLDTWKYKGNSWIIVGTQATPVLH